MKEAQPPQVLLEHYLKRLKLPSMLKGYKAIAELCAQEGADYTTFLLRLAERELLDREQRASPCSKPWTLSSSPHSPL